MSIIDHRAVPETPWRPNYRMWHIAGPEQGVSSTLAYSQVSPGAGAPLHYHEADELIVVLEGALEARLGDETQRVGPNHTIVVPPRVPHAFSSVGDDDAHVLAFFPSPTPSPTPRTSKANPQPRTATSPRPVEPPLMVSLSNHHPGSVEGSW